VYNSPILHFLNVVTIITAVLDLINVFVRGSGIQKFVKLIENSLDYSGIPIIVAFSIVILL